LRRKVVRLERFGRRGQRQFGIDILDLGGQSPIHAAQCKLREYGKTLSPTTISEEVNEARKFQPALGKYGIVTTAKVSTQAQTRILEISQAHREAGAFEVELLTWDKLCELLQLNETVRATFYGSIVIAPESSWSGPNPNRERTVSDCRRGVGVTNQLGDRRRTRRDSQT
jgi:hypothetical protein